MTQIKKVRERTSELMMLPIDMLINTKNSNLKIQPIYSLQKNNSIIDDTTPEIDLNNEFLPSPNQTFIIRTIGNSMIDCGINTNDLLIVDRTIKPRNGMIVIAEINNKITVKKYYSYENQIILEPANDNYSNIILTKNDNYKIWGVVTSVIKSL